MEGWLWTIGVGRLVHFVSRSESLTPITDTAFPVKGLFVYSEQLESENLRVWLRLLLNLGKMGITRYALKNTKLETLIAIIFHLRKD